MAGKIHTSPTLPVVEPVPFYEGAAEDELPSERVTASEPLDIQLIGWLIALALIFVSATICLTGGIDQSWLEVLMDL